MCVFVCVCVAAAAATAASVADVVLVNAVPSFAELVSLLSLGPALLILWVMNMSIDVL